MRFVPAECLPRLYAGLLLLGLPVFSGCDDTTPSRANEAGSGGAGLGGRGAGTGGKCGGNTSSPGGGAAPGPSGRAKSAAPAASKCGGAAVGGGTTDTGCPAELPVVGEPCQTREPLCTYKRPGGPCPPDRDQLRQCVNGTWKATVPAVSCDDAGAD